MIIRWIVARWHRPVPLQVWLGLLLLGCLFGLRVPGSSHVMADTPTPAPDPEQRAVAEGLFRQAQSLYAEHDVEGALAKYKEAATTYGAASDSEGQWVVTLRLGEVQEEVGRYDEALATYIEALDLARASVHDQELYTSEKLAVLYIDLGQFEDTIPIVERQVELARGKPDQETIATRLLGDLYGLTGDTTRAFQLYDQALELARREELRNEEGATLRDIGGAYALVGQFDRGVEYIQQAREIFKETNDKYLGNTSLTLLIQSYNFLKRYPEALALETEAAALAEGDPSREASTLKDIGDVYRNRGRYEKVAGDFDKALEYYGRADAIASQIGDNESRNGERYSLLAGIGSTEILQGRFESALQHLHQALDLAQFGPRYDPSTLRDIGYANEKLGHEDIALDFYDRSIAVGEQKRQASGLEDFRQGIGELYARSYGLAALLRFRLGEEADAFNLGERARAQTFLDLMTSKRLDIGERTDSELAERERELRNQLARLEQQKRDLVGSFDAEIENKRQEYADVREQLQRANPEYYSLLNAESLKLQDVQALLDDRTSLLSYFVMEEDTLAFVVSSSALKVVSLGIGEMQLHDATKALRDSNALKDEQPNGLEQFYDWLIRPLLPYLTTPTIGIIPFGDLHYLPFAALSDGQQFLGDTHVLFYLPSASALPFIQARHKDNPSTVLPMSYGLKYGRDEAEAIGKIYRADPELGDDATESLLRAQAGQSAVLHIAAHGDLSENSPLFSRVLLAPDKENDGELAVHEVYGLDLQATDVVVLSACQTQLGVRRGGDDVVGLTRAFIYAGSATVIASLWNVNDEATRVFMEHFYQALRDGKTKAEALQTAQQRTREQYPKPYYWAAFVLTGDPGPVAVKLGSEGGAGIPVLWLAAGAAGVLLLCIGVGLLWRSQRSHRARASEPAADTESDLLGDRR